MTLGNGLSVREHSIDLEAQDCTQKECGLELKFLLNNNVTIEVSSPNLLTPLYQRFLNGATYSPSQATIGSMFGKAIRYCGGVLSRKTARQSSALTLPPAMSTNGQKFLHLIHEQEAQVKKDDNHLIIVSIATMLLESEMTHLFCNRIKPIAGEVIAEIHACRPRFNTEVLESWASGASKTTLAIIEMLLHGVRWSLSRQNETIVGWLSQEYAPQYAEEVKKKRLANAIALIREQFRNPMAHGQMADVGNPEYQQFCCAMVGTKSFRKWLGQKSVNDHVAAGVLRAHVDYVRLAEQHAELRNT